jgi:nickel-dependent lactate racemase
LTQIFGAALSGALEGSFLGRGGQRVTVIISDPTRKEPREEMLVALREHLSPGAIVTLAIATGTHGPCRLADLGISESLLSSAKTIINHDGHRDADLVSVGTTTRGTPVIVHRCLIETDLVIATGCIRPHYFAGFGAGAKALFPGLGEAAAIRINHRLKTDPMSRAGILDGNPCREDLEEAVSMIPTATYLLNGVAGPDDRIHDAVAGAGLHVALRAGAERCRAWFTVRARRAPLVIASDALPVTATLYQAAKICAAVAPLIEENGTLVLAAECPGGIGPLETVNEAIFRIGVLPRLPRGARLVLVSGLDKRDVDQTLLEYAPSFDAVLASTSGPVTVVPRASQLLCEPVP